MATIFLGFPMVQTIGKQNYWLAWLFLCPNIIFLFIFDCLGQPKVKISNGPDIWKLDKNIMAAILSTIGKQNAFEKQNRPLQDLANNSTPPRYSQKILYSPSNRGQIVGR